MAEFDASRFLKNLTVRPGVYQMRDATGKILYVGKAKNLKARVSSYFRGGGLASKTMAMVAKIGDIDITVTRNEVEALLLEQNLIKDSRPPYNILLRDDKSYPYVYTNTEHPYPGLYYRRGGRQAGGKTFGPFPSAGAVKSTLNLIQKTFQIRQCEESVFQNRSRPCLQYQIGRCSAPCVGFVSQADYAEDLDHARLFLEGRSGELITSLEARMDEASHVLEFERAARYRNTISRVRRVQAEQVMESDSADLDAIAVSQQSGAICVAILSVRGGRVLGVNTQFPDSGILESPEEILDAFIPQYYLSSARVIPPELICSHEVNEAALVSLALSQASNKKVRIAFAVRGVRQQFLDLAKTNAEESLALRLSTRDGQAKRLADFAERFGCDVPDRIECFDISHTSGEATVASCVVFDSSGPLKSDYRIFNITDVKAGDDYAAMRQALTRRYRRVKSGEVPLPDVLVIDGGKGQMSEAVNILNELGMHSVFVLSVSKGPSRKAGFELLHRADTGEELSLPASAPALHLIQHIRDEAHRFAITKHRQARGKARSQSPLEGIPGVGPKRRQSLLRHFGGIRELARASVTDIAKVTGMSQQTAELVYSALHTD
ncbi:MAG: excinuclease ABC subunit UvrC [Pseudomonadota bacterium]|nr:excinuclease ABC subunit UvrC [Pseudomonadota bacterium]